MIRTVVIALALLLQDPFNLPPKSPLEEMTPTVTPGFNATEDWKELLNMPGLLVKSKPKGSACPVGPFHAFTANHVVDDDDVVVVGIPTPRGFPVIMVEGRVVQRWPKADLALIQLVRPLDHSKEAVTFLTFWFRAKNEPKIGERVRTVPVIIDDLDYLGNGFPRMPIEGLYIGRSKLEGDKDKPILLASAAISPGTSGSCLINEKNEVIGVAKGVHAWSKEEGGVPYHATFIYVPLFRGMWEEKEK